MWVTIVNIMFEKCSDIQYHLQENLYSKRKYKCYMRNKQYLKTTIIGTFDVSSNAFEF